MQVTNTKSTQIAFQSYYLCQRKEGKVGGSFFFVGVPVTYNESWRKNKVVTNFTHSWLHFFKGILDCL